MARLSDLALEVPVLDLLDLMDPVILMALALALLAAVAAALLLSLAPVALVAVALLAVALVVEEAVRSPRSSAVAVSIFVGSGGSVGHLR